MSTSETITSAIDTLCSSMNCTD